MAANTELIRKLREKTSAGMIDCRNALEEAKGDMEKAIEILRKKGAALASKKASRSAKQGLVASYIHADGKIGVLLEVNCETDFVARNDDFRAFVKELTLQIAAANPICVRREELSPELIEKEKEILKDQIKGKPDKGPEQILKGRMEKFYKETVLLEQPYIKDEKLAIQDLLNELIGKIGENIVIRRFTRYHLGEES